MKHLDELALPIQDSICGADDRTRPNMMAVSIEKLAAEAIIGVTDEERLTPRRLLIDVKVWLDPLTTATSDQLSATVDYKLIRDQVLACVTARPYLLLETVANLLVDLLLRIKRVQSCHVVVEKPGGLRLAGTVKVEAWGSSLACPPPRSDYPPLQSGS